MVCFSWSAFSYINLLGCIFFFFPFSSCSFGFRHRRLSDPAPHELLLHLLRSSNLHLFGLSFFFFFATRIYLLPMCCINSFEEEYHFEDERAAVLLCKQTRQKFETGKCTYKELCFIDEPFTKESILKAPKPLIPPAQSGGCVDVWMYILFIYLSLSRLRLIVWVWVSLHTQSPSSHHTVADGYLYCVCVCFFLLKRTLINSP